METIPTITVDMSLELLKRKVESLQGKGQSNNTHEPVRKMGQCEGSNAIF